MFKQTQIYSGTFPDQDLESEQMPFPALARVLLCSGPILRTGMGDALWGLYSNPDFFQTMGPSPDLGDPLGI